jgi:hypothetical protein
VTLPDVRGGGTAAVPRNGWYHDWYLRRTEDFTRKDPGGEAAMAEPTKEELMARIAELEKQSGSRKRGVIDFKVGEKGGVSVYGLGRFPVTLYYEQWIRLLDAAADLRAFLEENKSRLKLKDQQ